MRILRPASHRGVGADLPDALRVFEALARADASVGWTVAIGASAWCDLAGLPRATFDALFAVDGEVIIAGAINPTGSITAVDDGYRVRGRWGFASGCEHANWLLANCVEASGDGDPRLRAAVISPTDVTIEDTWRVSGLCGTGSHHFRADDVLVPAARTLQPMTDEPCIDDPIVHIPPPSMYSLEIASIATGIAQGALDDIAALAVDKVPLFAHDTLAASPLFQFDLATAHTELRAARALLYETAEEAWALASGRSPFTLQDRAKSRAAGVWVTQRAAAVVTSAYRLGGGSSIYSDCPLQRRLRDIDAITQHFLVKRDTLIAAGAVLVGHEPAVMVF